MSCFDCGFGRQMCCKFDDGDEACRYQKDCPTFKGMQKPQFGKGILFYFQSIFIILFCHNRVNFIITAKNITAPCPKFQDEDGNCIGNRINRLAI